MAADSRYTIYIARPARKELERLPAKAQERIELAMDGLAMELAPKAA